MCVTYRENYKIYICLSFLVLAKAYCYQIYKIGNAIHHLPCTTPFLNTLKLKGRQSNK